MRVGSQPCTLDGSFMHWHKTVLAVLPIKRRIHSENAPDFLHQNQSTFNSINTS